MEELLGVLHALCFVVLGHGFLFGLIFTFCGVIFWAMDERPLRLGWFSVCLPVRGRWARYLLAPVLLLVAVCGLGLTLVLLALLPPVAGLPLLIFGLIAAFSWVTGTPT